MNGRSAGGVRRVASPPVNSKVLLLSGGRRSSGQLAEALRNATEQTPGLDVLEIADADVEL
eukprot:scaffold58142_cov29-Prasinocladus_malaysianus.AAC.1